MQRRFAWLIAAAMGLGVLVGFVLNQALSPDAAKAAADHLSIVTDVFLRLIKMVIAPLVFSTLVVGVAHLEDSATVGRIGIRSLGWFLLASVVSLSIGFAMVQLTAPGASLDLPHGALSAASEGATVRVGFREFISHLVPVSIVEAMAKNEILQIVVFSVFAGAAIASLEGRAPQLVAAAEQISQVMLKITGYVMMLAPLVVFAALASTVATQGVGVVLTYAKFVGSFYLSLALLCGLLLAAAAVAVGRRIGELLGVIREPMLLAFSTTTSEAAYPGLMQGLQKFGAPRRIVSFVLPLGYSFNLDGSMMYCAYAALFIAQAYGVHLSFDQQALMLLMLLVMSKGVAGVPRASIVVVSAVLPYFSLPPEGIALLLGVDHLLDMGRSATNVVGNSVATVVMSRWEGQLEAPGREKTTGSVPDLSAEVEAFDGARLSR